MSMLGEQIKELRWLAGHLDETERGMDEYVRAMREAADTIEGLRYRLQAVDETCGEIVRCRDCAYAVVTHPLNLITGVPAGIEDWRCDYFWNADELCEVEPDGFCAWAKRKVDA